MEYVRKIVTQEQAANGIISNVLTDFGFVDETGKGFAGRDLNSTMDIAKAVKIYWKNDTAKQSFVRSIGDTDGFVSMWRPFRFFNSTGAWYGQNNSGSSWDAVGNCSLIGPSALHYGNDPNNTIIYTQLSLIPLINGGFIWNTIYRGGETSPTSLVLANASYPNDDTSGHLTSISNCSLIGIPPHSNSLNVQPKYSYISWADRSYRYYSTGSIRLLWDFLDRDIIICNSADSINISSTRPGYENLLNDIDHAQYTNLNKNVCVLIKMPKANGYLENVYLMSTAPSNFRSGGIFSFAGRTFINVYSNVVLELPND